MKYYDKIKKELIDNEITKKVKDYSKNRCDLESYYNVGKLLSDAGKEYGKGIIKQYSEKLMLEVGKKYNYRTLYRMRKFYQVFSNQKLTPMVSKLSWSHCIVLLSFDDINIINYYIEQSVKRNLSKRELEKIIKNKEYERLPDNTKSKLISNENMVMIDSIKNPIIINNYKYEEISEQILQKLILENIPSFLEELGDGFTFIKNEYKIKLGNRYNYIDLLLYNIKFKCYVVVELKVTELKKEHIGQIQIYMNYIDKHLKTIDENNTIGIIIVKKDNRYMIEYSSDSRIISREYILN